MKLPLIRPEDRSRSGMDSRLQQAWADTHPGCFRSEGFAEDLPEVEEVRPAGRFGGASPLLGLALGGMLGVFGR